MSLRTNLTAPPRSAAVLALVSVVAVACAVGGNVQPDVTDRVVPPMDVPGVDAPPSGDTGPTCPSGRTSCSGTCINLDNDLANCGMCGAACPMGNVCASGSCASTCPSPNTMCGALCINAQTDNANCGSCGHACGAGESCSSGTCVSLCPAPNMVCGGACTNVRSDNLNCGSCGNACTTGTFCVSGTCNSTCTAPNMMCGGVCTNTQSDNSNCGSCGRACGSGQSCSSGTCACPGGQMLCGGICVDTMSSSTNCGACGTACGSGQVCTSGMCRCGGALTLCTGTCVNTTMDSNHCGACGRACTGGASCVAGACSMAAPPNDNRASATVISFGAGEAMATGSTVGSTHDGPTSTCGCTSGGNVWYRFTLAGTEIVYVDTAGSSVDTSLFLTDSAGAAIANACNDDSGCGTAGGFTSGLQSRVSAYLTAGTYYIAVGGCALGAFTLHFQHIASTTASFMYSVPITGTATTASTVLVGTSRNSSTCGGAASGEDGRWFVTCGALQTFSLCASDGATFTRTAGGRNFDPAIYIYSGASGSITTCNDDGGAGCAGTGGDTLTYGSRVMGFMVARGIHAIIVDERLQTNGMTYTMRHTIR